MSNNSIEQRLEQLERLFQQQMQLTTMLQVELRSRQEEIHTLSNRIESLNSAVTGTYLELQTQRQKTMDIKGSVVALGSVVFGVDANSEQQVTTFVSRTHLKMWSDDNKITSVKDKVLAITEAAYEARKGEEDEQSD